MRRAARAQRDVRGAERDGRRAERLRQPDPDRAAAKAGANDHADGLVAEAGQRRRNAEAPLRAAAAGGRRRRGRCAGRRGAAATAGAARGAAVARRGAAAGG